LDKTPKITTEKKINHSTGSIDHQKGSGKKSGYRNPTKKTWLIRRTNSTAKIIIKKT
jgi:hypothetical protein